MLSFFFKNLNSNNNNKKLYICKFKYQIQSSKTFFFLCHSFIICESNKKKIFVTFVYSNHSNVCLCVCVCVYSAFGLFVLCCVSVNERFIFGFFFCQPKTRNKKFSPFLGIQLLATDHININIIFSNHGSIINHHKCLFKDEWKNQNQIRFFYQPIIYCSDYVATMIMMIQNCPNLEIIHFEIVHAAFQIQISTHTNTQIILKPTPEFIFFWFLVFSHW